MGNSNSIVEQVKRPPVPESSFDRNIRLRHEEHQAKQNVSLSKEEHDAQVLKVVQKLESMLVSHEQFIFRQLLTMSAPHHQDHTLPRVYSYFPMDTFTDMHASVKASACQTFLRGHQTILGIKIDDSSVTLVFPNPKRPSWIAPDHLQSLGYQMSPDYHERQRMAKKNGMF
jgi:hypothetical protein